MDKLKKLRGEAVAEGCGVGHVNSDINSIVFPLCTYKPQEPVTISAGPGEQKRGLGGVKKFFWIYNVV